MKKTLKADILAPEHMKTLRYEGNHPSRILKIIPDLIKDVFILTGTKLFEDVIKWDVSGDPVEFFGAWRGKDGKDKRTTVWVDIKVNGKQSKEKKEGFVIVYLTAYILTDVSTKGPGGQAVTWIYKKAFYSEQRKKYIEEARKRLNTLENEIRRYFEMMERR
jgi:hypothetical protein